ncbi:MAG: hypothetical protein QXN26_05250 [Thermoplasmataceae archaeon]
MINAIAAKIVLMAGSAVVAGTAIATGYHHGIAMALQNVPAWTHAHGILLRLSGEQHP